MTSPLLLSGWSVNADNSAQRRNLYHLQMHEPAFRFSNRSPESISRLEGPKSAPRTVATAWLSRGGDFRRRRACVFAKSLDDLLHDLARMRNDRDHDRVLVRPRLFQCRELAVEQRGGHEMPIACRQPPCDQVPRALQIDDADIAALANQDIAIGAFERRAGDGPVIPDAPRRVDPGGNAMQPGPAVLVSQRLAGVHLPDVGLWVEPVAVLVDPVQPVRKHRRNRTLAATRDSHHHDDGRIAR